MSRCPECAGNMKYNPVNRLMVCSSCGLSLTRNELDRYWSRIRNERGSDADEVQKAKDRRKEWLDWYSKSKDEKQNY
jgi:DNA-directed RNA polymerase subunit M/transcription elongation factor TFIIS